MPATIAGIHLGLDTHANRPAANAAGQPIGAVYSCSTHGLIYKTDGSSWATWATLGAAAPSANMFVDIGTPIFRTAGSHTCNSTTWVELAAATGGPGTGAYDFDFTGCQAGDVAAYAVMAGWGSEAVNAALTVETRVAGAHVNYFMGAPTSSSGDGVIGWYGFSGTFYGVSGTAFYTLQSGDLSAGALKLRLLYRTLTAANKTLYGTTGDSLMVMAWVMRP